RSPTGESRCSSLPRLPPFPLCSASERLRPSRQLPRRKAVASISASVRDRALVFTLLIVAAMISVAATVIRLALITAATARHVKQFARPRVWACAMFGWSVMAAVWSRSRAAVTASAISRSPLPMSAAARPFADPGLPPKKKPGLNPGFFYSDSDSGEGPKCLFPKPDGSLRLDAESDAHLHTVDIFTGLERHGVG